MAMSQPRNTVVEANIPKAIEAERSVLGSILANGSLIGEVNWLEPTDCYDERNAAIFAAMLAIEARGEIIDYVTLTTELEQGGRAKQASDDLVYLSSLLGSSLGPSGNISNYATLVANAAVLRRLISVGGQIATIGFREGVTSEDALASAERLLGSVAGSQATESLVPLLDALRAFIAESAARGAGSTEYVIPSGLPDLDVTINGGFGRSDLIVVAARPGIGKTAISLAFALKAAVEARQTVAFFSLEMSTSQLTARLLAQQSSVPLSAIRSQKMGEDEVSRLGRAYETFSSASIFIDDTSLITVATIRSRLRRLMRRQSVDMVIVDHLQLIAGDGTRGENRTQELSKISQQLKALAKDLNVPVVALCQLSREVERRPKKQPQLSDLRESGAIEQNADVVMLLYRDDYYDPQSSRANLMDVIVAKQRDGITDTITLFFNRTTGAFFSAEVVTQGEDNV